MAEQVKDAPAELIQTRVYELRPNKTMRKVLDEAGIKASPCGMKCIRQDKHLNLLCPPTPKS